jgi:hypothetical protein
VPASVEAHPLPFLPLAISPFYLNAPTPVDVLSSVSILSSMEKTLQVACDSAPASLEDFVKKGLPHSMTSLTKEKESITHCNVEENSVDVTIGEDTPRAGSWFSRNRGFVRCVKLCTLALFILAWWISATVLPATRHRWIVQTFFAWSFIAIIVFRFVPNSIVARPVQAVWVPLVERPFFALPRYARYGIGWLVLSAIVMGCAFGFELENVGCHGPFPSLSTHC